MASLFVRIAVQSVTFILLSRQLGPDGYGLFVGVVAISLLSAPLASLGFEFMMLRAISLEQAIASRAVGTGLAVIAVLGPAVCVVAWAICNVALPANAWRILWPIIIADVLLAPSIDMCGRAFQGAEMMNRAAVIRLILAAARCLAVVGVSVVSEAVTIEQWAMWYLIATATATAFALRSARRKFGPFIVDIALIRTNFSQSWHFSVNVLAERIVNDADKFLLTSLGSATIAGIYSAAYRLVEIFLVPIASLLLSANARVYRASAAGGVVSGQVVSVLLLAVAAYAVAAGIFLHLFAGFAPLVLGEEFTPSIAVILSLVALPLLYGIRSTLWLALAANGLHGSRTTTQLLVAFLNVAMNWSLIPTYGWRGSAYATLCCEAVLVVLFAVRFAVHFRRNSGHGDK